MKRSFVCALFALSFNVAFAQITVNNQSPNNSIQYLVDSIFIGSGIVASNHTFEGDTNQLGFFDGMMSNIGVDSGVVMSTGGINNLDPNFTGFISPINNNVSDPDLLEVANSVPPLIGQNFSVQSVNDIAKIEFTFVPSTPTIAFNYVFASQEYFGFENTQYNDVFGFFVAGPGINGPYYSPDEFPNGSINIATIENSTINYQNTDTIVYESFEDTINLNWSLNQAVNNLGTNIPINNQFVVNNQYEGALVDLGDDGLFQIQNTPFNYSIIPWNSNYLHTSIIGYGTQNSSWDSFYSGEPISALSPSYSIVDYQNLNLSFWWRSGYYVETFILYSNNQGDTWQLLDTLSNELTLNEFEDIGNGTDPDTTWQFNSYNLNEIDNSMNVQFAFVSSTNYGQFNDGYGQFAKGFALDNFMLTGQYSFSQETEDLPITVSSVNQSVNSEYFVNNQSLTTVADADGFTTELIATTQVIPGETYYMRLAIGDGSDNALSSYVLLESPSFISYGIPQDDLINTYCTNYESEDFITYYSYNLDLSDYLFLNTIQSVEATFDLSFYTMDMIDQTSINNLIIETTFPIEALNSGEIYLIYEADTLATIDINNISCVNLCENSLSTQVFNNECNPGLELNYNPGILVQNQFSFPQLESNVQIEIINLGTQVQFGTELDYLDSYYFNLPVGEYLLSAYFTDVDCYYNEEFTVQDNSININYYSNPASGAFESNGSISLNISSGNPSYFVSAYGPNGYSEFFNSINNQLFIGNLQSGLYTFYISDEFNCTETLEVFLNFIPDVFGCTDSSAMNYNALANIDDGSCDYCQLTLVSSENTFCTDYNGYIEVASGSPNYQYDIQILENGVWTSYGDGCFDYLSNGASWSCLPADTFMIIGYGPNCIDTLSNSTVNLTELIESEQLDMNLLYQLSDDVYSDTISIGFPFVYNGTVYEECLISSNNYLSFDVGNAMQYSPWSINNAVPTNLNPLNAIMTPYQDLNPNYGGEIEYLTYGIAPNRVFIVRWKEIPMFSCTQELFSSTLYLFEGSNIIETHIETKPICEAWNEGAAIHALHNSNGTQADVVFDSNINEFRNYPILWTTVNDGYQFIPNANGVNYEINEIEYGTQYNSDAYLTTTIEGQFGCTDSMALNYNPNAYCDDNSCIYPLVYGCTDSTSYNYNPMANINDGSCCYQNALTIVVNTGEVPWQSTWNLTDINGVPMYIDMDTNYTPNLDSASTQFFCMSDGCYQINMFNWIGGSIDLYYNDYQFLSIEPAIGSEITTLQFCLPIELIGCTDEFACNFDEFANEDDGSCSYPESVFQEIVVCDGIEFNGEYYNESFTTIDTLISSGGCDSLVTTTYSIQYSPEANMFIDFITNVLSVQTAILPQNIEYLWNTNETTQSIYVDTNGVYSVIVTDTTNNCSSSTSINVTWIELSDISENGEELYFNIYPNPSSGMFKIELFSNKNEIIDLQIINMLGETVYNKSYVNSSNINHNEKVDLSNQANGIYLLKINTSVKNYHFRLSKN